MSLSTIFNRYVTWPARQLIGGFWDHVYRVETRGGVISDESLGITSENRDKGVVYDPTPWSVVKTVAQLLPKGQPDFCFVDVGSGKGRVIMAAAALPYRRVVGVEYSPYLCRIANENLQSQRILPRRTGQVSIVCGDATEFPIPNGACIFFFYNPFAPEIIERMISNMVASFQEQPRELYLVFFASSKAISGLKPDAHLLLRKQSAVRCDLFYWRSVSVYQIA